MLTALVTGPTAPAEDIADVLRARGLRPLCVSYGLPLAAAAASITDSSLACYVQLPDVDPNVNCVDDDLRTVIVRSLLARFDALELVAPLLAPHATTLLVPGHDGDSALFRVLAGAVLAQHGADPVTTSVVDRKALRTAIGDLASPEPVDPGDRPDTSDYASVAPELDFSERRSRLLNLTTDYWVG